MINSSRSTLGYPGTTGGLGDHFGVGGGDVILGIAAVRIGGIAAIGTHYSVEDAGPVYSGPIRLKAPKSGHSPGNSIPAKRHSESLTSVQRAGRRTILYYYDSPNGRATTRVANRSDDSGNAIRPEWVAQQPHDPGITVSQLLAWLIDAVRLNSLALDEQNRTRLEKLLAKCTVAPSPGNCDTSAGLTRPRYFNGQLLTADDLQAEQNYFREKLRRHNRCLHGWGVVRGLEVTQDPKDNSMSLYLAHIDYFAKCKNYSIDCLHQSHLRTE